MLQVLTDEGDDIRGLCKLVFIDTITIYYSWQHPIAFCSQGKLFVRNEFWVRKRSDRGVHTINISRDSYKARPLAKIAVELVYPDNFFIALQEEFDFHNLSFVTKAAATTKVKPSARKVKL